MFMCVRERGRDITEEKMYECEKHFPIPCTKINGFLWMKHEHLLYGKMATHLIFGQ